jgi:hypothetical protein
MPTDKDFKRLVRARMQKTGESYTAARTNLLQKKHPIPANYAALAGTSDATVRAKTGKTWIQWVRALDAEDAASKPHRAIAALLNEQFGVPGWWSQTVTVGYERIRGLRDVGQRRGGGYEASKSKTVPVPVAKLYRAWSDKRTRVRWLDAPLTIRTATRNKSMRITWEDGSSVEVYFVAKGRGKSLVAVQHVKLAGKADATRRKAFWGERLGVLAEMLRE